MFNNYNKNSDNLSSSNIFNVSGQNIMSNGKNIDTILNENKKLKVEISKKNKEIENAIKRLQILEREIESLKKQKNNNQIKNRGRSVGMRSNANNINVNNYFNNDFNGGMFINDNDPFNDSFFQFNN